MGPGDGNRSGTPTCDYLIAVPDPTDGRANLLRLTERGTDMLQLAVGIQADLENSRPDDMWRSGRIPLDG